MTAKDASASDDVLNVGIDLGTSRSSISTSDGEKHVVESYVGWPADMVAMKVLKKKIMIGEEALKKRVMLDLHRPLERGLIKEGSEKDLMAVRELLSHLLVRAGVKKGQTKRTVRAVVGVPAEAMRVNMQQLRNAMSGVVDSLMIVSEPFAVAYALDALLHSLIIDIGAGTTDFCVMNGRYPTDEDQRTLTNAGDSIDEQLNKLIAERHPEVNFSSHMVREWKEQNAFVGEPSGKIVVTAPVKGKPTQFDITTEIRTACESVVAPVTETMLELIAKVEPEYQEEVRNNIILTGGTGLIRGLAEALEAALREYGGGSVTVVEDPVFVGSDGGLAIALDAPKSDWEKLGPA
ncbi:MAG: rod shape-determining protein [Acidobacteriota bacterium]|nr:rod shape-determining protein [Acidobacteriota bacterium]